MLLSLNQQPELTILDTVPLRREHKLGKQLGDIVSQDQLVKLVGIAFHRSITAEKLIAKFKGGRGLPSQSDCWELTKRDIRNKQTQKEGCGECGDEKPHSPAGGGGAQDANAVRYDDINKHFCNFDHFE